MKKDIHPPYYKNAKVTCSCGQTFEVGSTSKDFTVEVCSACHPFYTGTAKFIDTAGRVDKFKERMKKAEIYKSLRRGSRSSDTKSSEKKVNK